MLCCYTPPPLLTHIICSSWFSTADDSCALRAFPISFWPKNSRMRRQFLKYLTWQFRQHSNRYVNKIITFRFRPFRVPFNTPFPLIQREFRFEMMSQGKNRSVVMCVCVVRYITKTTYSHSNENTQICQQINKMNESSNDKRDPNPFTANELKTCHFPFRCSAQHRLALRLCLMLVNAFIRCRMGNWKWQ